MTGRFHSLLRLPLIAAVACCAACGGPRGPGQFDGVTADSRLEAIARAAAREDLSAIPRIIEALDSDDAATRMAAITALERLTGDRLAFEHYDRPPVRSALIRELAERVDSDQHAPPGSPTAVAEGASGDG